MKHRYIFLLALVAFSCQNEKEPVDTIVFNAKIYTVNDNFDTAEAFAVKDGKFVEVGTSQAIQEKYQALKNVDAQGQAIFPGLIDAHAHFLSLGQFLQQVNLVGTTSFDDMMKRILDFQNENNLPYIKGRGWDQNDWEDKTMPTKALLDKLFPHTPISLTRIDGHAILCNQAALDLGNVTVNSKVDGGEVMVVNGQLTGVLIDNAEQLVMDHWPKPTREELVDALMKAQDVCIKNGLTTISDAGPDIFTTPWTPVISLVDSLQNTGDLKVRLYMMVPATPTNLDYYLAKEPYKTNRLNVCSFKFYADGALGSRGAALREEYSDQPGHYGQLVQGLEYLRTTAQRIAKSPYQMNTHAIGDSANHVVIQTYKKVLEGKQDRRWRIEHAQVVSPEDFAQFNTIIPSVQPTHATSDMYWAEDRLGSKRIHNAYAYKKLLEAYGKLPLGTDFPVEQVSPMLTFYAAVARQDLEHYPKGGFESDNALTREEALKGMTIWAAYSNFEEKEKGSIEAGKLADFVILNKDIMTVAIDEVPTTKVEKTFINGEEF
ncbi:MAG: amidohydrolase [Flavobacteriaceae bacterium]|nr:amidohydrolase [Mangrovimonas sp.]